MDKQSYIKHLFEMREHWENRIIAKERTISTFGEFFTDAELEKEYQKLEVLRSNYEAINNELAVLVDFDTGIER